MSAERKHYCRFCGENKGHNSTECKRVAAIKKVLASQDQELRSYVDENVRLREQLKQQQNTSDENTQLVVNLKSQATLLSRLLIVLLDVIDGRRK